MLIFWNAYSIQFTLFWIPALVLIGWALNEPLTLLFGTSPFILYGNCCLICSIADHFEVVVVVGACFLVNSVTQDGRTNWSEGMIMIGFYVIIVRPCSLAFSLQAYIDMLLVLFYRLSRHGTTQVKQRPISYSSVSRLLGFWNRRLLRLHQLIEYIKLNRCKGWVYWRTHFHSILNKWTIAFILYVFQHWNQGSTYFILSLNVMLSLDEKNKALIHNSSTISQDSNCATAKWAIGSSRWISLSSPSLNSISSATPPTDLDGLRQNLCWVFDDTAQICRLLVGGAS